MDARIGVTKRVETAVENAQILIDDADTVIEVAGSYDQLQRLLPALQAARDRGVVVRAVVYVDDGQTPPPNFGPTDALSELRVCSIPGPFLVIIDRHRTCFAPNTRSDEVYGVLVNDRLLPFVFHWYYLTCLWNPYQRIYIDESEQFTYVTLDTDEETVVLGGWGAVFEDIELRMVSLVGLEARTMPSHEGYSLAPHRACSLRKAA